MTMIIDGHSHVTFPVEGHIQEMNRAGVDKTILFSTSLHPEQANSTEEVKAAMQYLNAVLAGKKGSMTELRQKINKELRDAIALHPDRFIGFGSVPLGLDAKATRQFIADELAGFGLAGMGEFTLASGQVHLLEPVFAASPEFGHLPIWIHAFFPITMADIREMALLARRFPRTPVIIGHLGGSNWLETVELVKDIPNLYLDTSAFYSTLVLGVAINDLPHKCVFGVDKPYGDTELSIQAIRKYARTPQVAEAVLGGNMAQILGL